MNRIQANSNEKFKSTNEILKYHFVNRFQKINKYDEAVILRSKQFQNKLGTVSQLDLERLYNDKILLISGNGLYNFNLSTLKDILEKNQTDDPKIDTLDGFYIVSKLAHSVKISDRFVDSILIKNGYTYTRIKIQNWTDEISIAADGDFTIKLELGNHQSIQEGCHPFKTMSVIHKLQFCFFGTQLRLRMCFRGSCNSYHTSNIIMN